MTENDNGPVGSIDPTGLGIRFDPELDAALGSFGEHRWQVVLYELAQKYGLGDSNLHQVGDWLLTHGKKGSQDWKDWQGAVHDQAAVLHAEQQLRRDIETGGGQTE